MIIIPLDRKTIQKNPFGKLVQKAMENHNF